jgi:sigma-B regulation protein RsbU (phosphoserine phosphatase)
MSDAQTVLIIEDEDKLRRTVAAYLEDSGYLVTEAGNGREGIEQFEKNRPCVVLTDLRMPEMNGLEVIVWLQQNSPGTPIIVITGTGDECAPAAVIAAGAKMCLSKPINDLALLDTAIRQVLNPK